MQSTREPRLIKTIRLDDARVAKILERIDSQGGAAPVERRAPRFRYRKPAMVVHMAQPGSSEAAPFLVPTRNLSATGMSFLHGGFVHTGTRVLAQMASADGRWDRVVGTVVRCRLIEGTIHEVGVHFAHDIDPANYAVAAFRGRLLVGEHDEASARFVTFHLEQIGAEVLHAGDGEDALSKAGAEDLHLILLDANLPKLGGPEVAAGLRRQGYRGALAIATVSKNPADHQLMLRAGADRILVKPYSRSNVEALTGFVLEWRKQAAAIENPS